MMKLSPDEWWSYSTLPDSIRREVSEKCPQAALQLFSKRDALCLGLTVNDVDVLCIPGIDMWWTEHVIVCGIANNEEGEVCYFIYLLSFLPRKNPIQIPQVDNAEVEEKILLEGISAARKECSTTLELLPGTVSPAIRPTQEVMHFAYSVMKVTTHVFCLHNKHLVTVAP